MYRYKCTLSKVVDGDTMDFMVDLGFKVYAKIRVRLVDIDVYERSTDKGKEATAFCKEWFEGKDIEIETYKTGKYGRWLAHVYCGDECLNELLKEKGYDKFIKN